MNRPAGRATRPVAIGMALLLVLAGSSQAWGAEAEPSIDAVPGISVTPRTTPADAVGTFTFRLVDEAMLAGLAGLLVGSGFGGVLGSGSPDLGPILAMLPSVEVAANGTGSLPPLPPGRQLILLDEPPAGFIAESVTCLGPGGETLVETGIPAAEGSAFAAAIVELDVAAGAAIACTFDFVRSASLVIATETPDPDAVGTFTFRILDEAILESFLGGGSFGLFFGTFPPEAMMALILAAATAIEVPANGSASLPDLPPGTYTLGLDAPPGMVTAIDCRDAAGQAIGEAVLATGSVRLEIAAAAALDCRFSIDAVPGSVRATVDVDRPKAGSSFSLEMANETVALQPGGTAVDEDAPAGVYRMALLRDPEHRLQDIDCRDWMDRRQPAGIDFEGQSVALTIGISARVTCTFQLERLAAIVTATIQVVGDGDPSLGRPFSLDLNGRTEQLQAGDVATDDDAPFDLYRMALAPDANHRLIDIDCQDRSGERVPAQTDFENQSIAFAPGIGGSVSCTFQLEVQSSGVGSDDGPDETSDDPGTSTGSATEDDPSTDDEDEIPASPEPTPEPSPEPTPEDEALLPRAGRWSAVNAATTLSCGPAAFRLPRETDEGRLELTRGGRRIVATGLTGSRPRIVLDRVETLPGFYRGQVRVNLQGFTLPLRYEMRVITDRQIEGTIRANIRVRTGGVAVRCQIDRPFTLRFVGP